MKKIVMILFTLSIFYACKHDQKIDTRIVIAGELKGAEGEILTLNTFEELDRVQISEDGSFHFSITHDHSFYFNLSAKNQIFQVFLEPGDSIYVNADMEDFHSTFKATGSKAREASFLTQKGKIFKELGPFFAFTELPKDEYQEKKAEHLKPFQELIREMETEKNLNEDYLILEQSAIEYYELYIDDMYPYNFRRAHGIAEHEPIDFPEQEIRDKINNLNLDDPLRFYLMYHRRFMDRKLNELRSTMYNEIPENEKNKSLWMKYTLLAVDSLFKHPKVNSYAKFWHLYLHMTMEGPEDVFDSYYHFVNDNKYPMYSQRLENIIKVWEALKPGQLIPEFAFTEPDGNPVSLHNLKGKPAYILVWDTGCGPCRYEHTFWNSLSEEYHGREINFITISFDKKKDEWLSYINEKTIEGINLHDEKHFLSPLAYHFMIKGVPKFILLDADGKIFNANPPRASGAIREELEKLL
jgi:thiol-disulfide isomerase/thioredoxin